MRGPAAAVVVFPGCNGERDLAETFTRAGFVARYHPSTEPIPSQTAVVGLPGGFSYGDYWRAGVLASRATAMQSLPDAIAMGTLAIGICNGFQILVESGMLPGALAGNAPPGFRHRWLEVRVDQAIPSPWFRHVPNGSVLRMPMAHGEGRYVHPGDTSAIRERIPLRYVDNPNGSLDDAAALLDETGAVLGIMPHPERASEAILGSEDGLALFTSARRWLKAAT